jgi:hypothetical protein
MGLLSWLNRNATGIDITDPGYRRADRAAKRGDASVATVVGIEYKLDDGTTKRFIAVSDGEHVSGIETGHGPAAAHSRLHLGAEVRIRVDGDKVVLDMPEIPQKFRRKPPAPGVVDRAQRLKKWTPRRATIVSLSRRDSAFGPTLNFDVTLRLGDGTGAHAAKSEIPFYAAWLAAPGAEVPVLTDGDRAVIDWAAAANEPNRPAGGPDDPPPPGSAATQY